MGQKKLIENETSYQTRMQKELERQEEFDRKVRAIDKRIIETLWTILLSAAAAVIVVLAATG